VCVRVGRWVGASHIDSRRNTNLSQTCLKIIFVNLNFCVGDLSVLKFHHSHHFVTIIWYKRCINDKLQYNNDNLLTLTH
jgi:hypothetical protein